MFLIRLRYKSCGNSLTCTTCTGKYSSTSGSPVGENFNIHSVIPKFHKHLQFHHLSISHNNRDACLVDSGLVYLFQIDEDQSDIETGLDICLELDAEGSNQIGSSYESASKKKWSFLEKIIKKNRHDEIVDVASSKFLIHFVWLSE